MDEPGHVQERETGRWADDWVLASVHASVTTTLIPNDMSLIAQTYKERRTMALAEWRKLVREPHSARIVAPTEARSLADRRHCRLVPG
jgi:hypothetical protein